MSNLNPSLDDTATRTRTSASILFWRCYGKMKGSARDGVVFMGEIRVVGSLPGRRGRCYERHRFFEAIFHRNAVLRIALALISTSLPRAPDEKMRLIIEADSDKASDWVAKYIKTRIKSFKPGPDPDNPEKTRYFVLGLPTGDDTNSSSEPRGLAR